MDNKRPRGPEEQGGVPQGPEDAAAHGNRGELRLQVIKSACREWGKCKLAWGKREICDAKWINVCLLIVSDHGTSGEVNGTSLLVSSAL